MALKISRTLLLLTIACAPARVLYAQFSFPYDPDFQQSQAPVPTEQISTALPQPPSGNEAQPKPQGEATPPPLSPSAKEGVDFLIRSAGPFLLFDRADPTHFFEQPLSTEPVEFGEFLAELKTFRIDQAKWNQARTDLEQGTIPMDEIDLPVMPLSPSEILISSETPRPPPPEVEMPSYGTSLSVTGRKVIGVNFTEKQYLHDQSLTGRAQTTNLIDIQQQLQLRMQGKIGPKIAVNVDFDDTKANKQDISVVYNGDPNEVVQNASFGDIDLSLPATEFVSYNKQLFGIRADLKWRGWKSTFIGSRTKGTTKTRQFIGNTQFATLDMLDTSYIRRSRYDLTFASATLLPIQAGSEQIWLAPMNAQQSNNTNFQQKIADDFAVPSSSVNAQFYQLAAGTDYTIDYVKGIINFRIGIQPQYIIAVDFKDARGSHIINQTASTSTLPTGNLKLIKTFSDIPISVSTPVAEIGFNRELKTFYSLGQTQIVRDDGRGSFILQVLDPHTRQEVGSTLNPVEHYPQTIQVDFENGFFQLLQPFGASFSSATPDPDIYSPTPITKRIFHVEYHYRLKTFILEPNLVLQSEVVMVDGVRLNRNVDYFIDYDSGFITFFNEQRITPTSEVDISYEVAPFAGIASDSILGTRVSYDFNKHWSMGSTLLYESGTKAPTVPSVTDLARSLLIYDADTQIKDVRLLPKLKGTFQGEIARSNMDPNLNGNALIDNMEGAKQEDSANLLASQWQVASNPSNVPADPYAFASTNTVPTTQNPGWLNEDFSVLGINPNAQAGPRDTQKILRFNYNFDPVTTNGTTEASLVYVFSPTGLDFSQKTFLEVTMLGDGSNNEINFKLGGINEDADGAGGMTLTCNGVTNGNAPKTEDTNCDGVLQPGEDTGWLYCPGHLPDGSCPPGPFHSIRYGAGNGKIDTEDLNQNGRLDPEDSSGDNFGYNYSTGTNNNQLYDVTSGSSRTQIDFGGKFEPDPLHPKWHTFQIPLNISTATQANWVAVKELRISIRQRAGGDPSGALRFARISVVGNSWQPGQVGDPQFNTGPIATESLAVSAVNNVENPNYAPYAIFHSGGDAQSVFNDLYGGLSNLQKQSNTSNISEQSLQLQWSGLQQGATVYTRRIFPRALDVSQHREFNFLLYGNAQTTLTKPADTSGAQTFFMRVGSDHVFFEARVPLNFIGWKKIVIHQIDEGGTRVANNWESGTPGVVVLSTGGANLQQVAEMVVGVYGSNASPVTSGAVWVDEVYVSVPMTRVGNAQKLQMDFDVPGWATFGSKYRFVDRNFQTPTTVVSNQDNRQDSGYLNFTRIGFLPLKFLLNRTITDTPNTNTVGSNSNLVNLLQSGKVTNWNGTAHGDFLYGAYPRLSLDYNRNRIEYDLLTRLDDAKTYKGALSYAVPLNHWFTPRSVDLNYSYSRKDTSFDRFDVLLLPGNYNTNEFTNTYGSRLSFIPWGGSSFNPNYSLTVVKENRADFTSGTELDSRYPKSLNETVGFSSNFRLLSWLNPSVNYSINNIESNLLTVSTFVVNGSTAVFNPGDIKTINRNANGTISLPFNISEIFHTTKLFHSMNIANNYQLQDGEVWNNVEKELDSKGALFVRQPIHPQSLGAQQANLSLRDTFNSTQRWSPLEGYSLAGRLAAFRTLNISNNYVKSIQRVETTGTPSKTISTTLPDVITSIQQLEKLAHAERWLSNGQITLKYNAHQTETIGTTLSHDNALGSDLRGMIRKHFDTAISVNIRNSSTKDLIQDVITQLTHHEDATIQTTFDIKQFRFTPKIDYSKDTAQQGNGIQTQNLTVYTPSILARADLAIPRGLMLPFTNKTLIFTNRIIWTNNLSFSIRQSPVTQIDNSRLLTYNTSGDYELAKNLRMTLNGAFSRLWSVFLPQEDFVSFQFGTTITLQF